MYHSIIFTDQNGSSINTWDDWHLIPSSRPVFSPPSLKTRFVDIPGANGYLDLTESLTGYPLYGDRSGSFEFIVDNDFKPWYQTYSDVMDFLHGKKLKAVLEDDLEFFYEGRFTISEWNSKDTIASRSTITIDYNVAPFKWSAESSTDNWLWDPFNFYTGVIRAVQFKNIEVNSNVEWIEKDLTIDMIGRAPASPTLIVSSKSGDGIDVRFVNEKLEIDDTKHLSDGRTQILDWVFTGDPVKFYFKGYGMISIDFRVGRL